MSCIQAEYLCKDGITCVHRSWICDGEQDCPGGDDEMMPNCQNITCRADQFQCADKSCIAGHFHCSGKAECRDGSDELNCRKHYKLFNPLLSSHEVQFSIFLAVSQLRQSEHATAKRNLIVVVGCAFHCRKYVIRTKTVPTLKTSQLTNADVMNANRITGAALKCVWTLKQASIVSADPASNLWTTKHARTSMNVKSPDHALSCAQTNVGHLR